jgi:hypothetical protein
MELLLKVEVKYDIKQRFQRACPQDSFGYNDAGIITGGRGGGGRCYRLHGDQNNGYILKKAVRCSGVISSCKKFL